MSDRPGRGSASPPAASATLPGRSQVRTKPVGMSPATTANAAQQARMRRGSGDDLGLRRAISDRILPFLVAAMAFLAALALAGAVGTASLARHWQNGAAAALTIQVPHPTDPAADAAQAPHGGTRLAQVLGVLGATPGIASARALTAPELTQLLRPWLGAGVEQLALPLPAVIEVQLAPGGTLDLGGLGSRLAALAPGVELEQQGVWIERLSHLARSLQACAAIAVLVVACVAAAVIAVATRAGLVARREAIEIVHGLGATDRYIAGRFAGRATMLAAIGGALGTLAAVPVLIVLANLAAPFAGGPEGATLAGTAGAMAPGLTADGSVLSALPTAILLALPALPLIAAAIGFVSAQATVRLWLRGLP